MAVGVNWGPPLTDDVAGLTNGEAAECKMGVYTSKDGGATWAFHTAPAPPVRQTMPVHPTRCEGDPALVFDAQDRLHLTGIAQAGDDLLPPPAGSGQGFMTYYTRSDDLGATWSPPVILSDLDPAQDRNWMALDPATGAVVVDWQNTAKDFANWTVQLAWSLDRGATWATQEAPQRSVCAPPGPLLPHAGDLLYTCRNATGNDVHLLVYAFDLANRTGALRAALNVSGAWPGLAALRDGTLSQHWDDGDAPDTKLAWSRDHGRTWTEPASLRALLDGQPAGAHAYWAEGDAHGALHLIAQADAAPVAPVPGAPAHHELRHVVLAANGSKLQETVLAAWDDTEPPTPRPALTLGDHYYGIARAGDRTLLAFTRDSAIDLTLAAPKLPGA